MEETRDNVRNVAYERVSVYYSPSIEEYVRIRIYIYR